MGINAHQFLDNIIEPTLNCMGRIIDPRMAYESAKFQLLGTACAESQLTYLKQLNSGPALGFYQMEPATYADICNWADLIDIRECKKDPKRPKHLFREKIVYCIFQEGRKDFPHGSQLIYNLRMQTVFARLHYWRVKEPIPTATPLQAKFWKKYYNTELGQGTVQHYLNSFPVLS